MAAIFPDDIFKCIVWNENVWISIKVSLTFVPKGPINNTPALVQIIHYLNQWWLVYWRIYASLGVDELNRTMLSIVLGIKNKNLSTG